MGFDFNIKSYLSRSLTETSIRTEKDETLWGCPVCNTGHLPYERWMEHKEDASHKDRMKQFHKWKDFVNQVVAREMEMADWKRRIALIGSQQWQDEINAKLYQYFAEGQERVKIDLCRQLHEYELAEQMVVLDLAVWKVSCQLSNTTPLHSALDWHCWMTTGWKDRKAEVRSSNSMDIILTLVFPFLHGPRDPLANASTEASGGCRE